MGNILGFSVCVIAGVLCFGLWISVVIRLLSKKFVAVKTADAVVIDKHIADNVNYSKWQSLFPCKNCVIIFDCDGRRVHFNVAEISYDNYIIGQRGTLKYRGRTLIDFS